MEYGLCVVVGFLLAVCFVNRPFKAKIKAEEPTPEEKRRAEKALREYKNFMNYNGFTSDNDE